MMLLQRVNHPKSADVFKLQRFPHLRRVCCRFTMDILWEYKIKPIQYRNGEYNQLRVPITRSGRRLILYEKSLYVVHVDFNFV